MTTRTDMMSTPIAEGTTAVLSFQVQDENGAGIDAANLDSLTMTLYDMLTEGILNYREETDILNDGPGAVDGDGNVTITLTPEDTVVVGTASTEDHIALITWTYPSGGAKTGKHEIRLRVTHLTNVLD